MKSKNHIMRTFFWVTIGSIFVTILGKAVISNVALAKDRKLESQNSFQICLEVVQGNYYNLNKLLGENSTLKTLNFRSNKPSLYSDKQTKELGKISKQCTLSLSPPLFLPFEFVNAMDLNKIFSFVTHPIYSSHNKDN